MYIVRIYYYSSSSSGPAHFPKHTPVGLPAYLWSCFLQILHYSTTYWIMRPKCAGSLSSVFGIVPFRYCATGMITFLRYCTTNSGSFQRDVGGELDGGSVFDSPETGGDSSRCS